MSGKTFYIRDASKLVNSKKMEDSTLGFRTEWCAEKWVFYKWSNVLYESG